MYVQIYWYLLFIYEFSFQCLKEGRGRDTQWAGFLCPSYYVPILPFWIWVSLLLVHMETTQHSFHGESPMEPTNHEII